MKRGADGLIFNDTRRERFGSKRKIVTNSHRTTDKFDITSQCARSDVKGVTDEKSARVHVRALTEIKCVSEPDRVYLVIVWSKEKTGPYLRVGDVHTTRRKSQRRLVVFSDFA